MDAPIVYVIIVNWNGLEHLDACFQSLLACTYPNVVFLLTDNASTDDSVALVRGRFGEDSRVEILELPENRGWSGGNNAGIERALAAGADYLFLLNNDTATDRDAIPMLVERMEANPALGALAPRMVMFEQPDILNSVGLRLSVIGAAWDIGIGRLDSPAWHLPEPVIGVCGGALFLRAAALKRSGLLPEDFEIYLDDLDLCLRLWNAGFRIERCAGAVVRHKFSATMGAGPRARRKYYLNTRNRFRILLRHFPVRCLHQVLPRLVLGEARAIGRGMLSGEWWRLSAHARAWCSALAYIPNAVRFRTASPVSGLPAFWPLIRRSPLFCPALVLPEAGWYPAVNRSGARWRPMSARARVMVSAGELQVRLLNCYPALGDARISLYLEQSYLGELHTRSTTEARFLVEAGCLEVVAASCFRLEDTGEAADCGAWLQVACGGTPLL